MKWIDNFIRWRYPQQLNVEQLLDLPLIHEPDVNLVYVKRPVDRDIECFARILIEESFGGINAIVKVESVAGIVADHLNVMGMDSPGKIKLTHDIVKITHAFIHLTASDHVRLILKIVSHDACRKFHTDAYNLRLLCTYFGKGTEWVEDQYVNKKKLISGSNDDIIKDFSRIRHMEPFEVAIQCRLVKVCKP